MTDPIIETFNLSKVYKLKQRKKEIVALNKVNLSINRGEIFGLLGPNGAGKTTIIQILTTLRQPTSGYAIIDGYNLLKKPKKAKSKVALMLDDKMLYYRITAYDNLKFFSKIYNVQNYKKKINDIATEFGLEKWLNQYVENFSSGMKMKLALCRTLLLDREILFLDEPTLGLDVNSVAFITDKLKNLNKTIFLTSHDMKVVEKLCHRIAFINNGTILKIGTQEDISKLVQTKINVKIVLKEKKEQFKQELNYCEFVTNVTNSKEGFTITLRSRENYKNLFPILSKYSILKIQELDLSLEDLFMKII